MAEKKIFTSLAFQSGAKLVAPKVEARTPLATLTDPTDSNYYTGSAGQLAYNNGNIWVNNDSIWTKLLNHATTATISGEFTFDRVSNNVGQAPFVIGSNSQHKFVSGLQAETLGTNSATLADGTHGISDTATEHGIPVYGSGGVLPVATPTADGHAANKGYVDTVAQGLSIKTAVRCATTAPITVATALNAGDSIDGVTLANGDRVLVKDQTATNGNGIYVVAASPARATDYDAASEINDGDFFFVQEGTTNGNKGFVQTKNVTALGTGHAIEFEQFSEAGNLEVYSQSGTADASKTSGPLIQVGNDVTFGYNENIFNLDSNKNLHLKPAGIGGDRLQNNTVTPTQLQDTGDFTMGGLTVVGGNAQIALTDNSSPGSYPTYELFANGDELRIGRDNGVWPTDFLRLNHTGDLTVGNNLLVTNKIGIGADATSPSGTLHVSTARYSSTNLVSNGTFASNLSSWTITTNGQTVERTSAGKLRIASSGAFASARQDITLEDGVRYKLTYDAVVTSGTGYVKDNADTDDIPLQQINSTGSYTHYFTHSSGTFRLMFARNATPCDFTIDNVSIVEDPLSTSANLSVDSNADDLVIANNADAGLTLMTPHGNKGRIFFGSRGYNAHSRIFASLDSNNDSTLIFSASNNGSANTALTLFGNDKSAKFAGGVGINGIVATDPLSVKGEAADDYVARFYRSDNGNTLVDVHQDSNNHGGLFVRDSSGTTKVKLFTSGTSYFNGGNVAIGGTTARSPLHVGGDVSTTADATSATAFIKQSGATSYSGLYMERSGQQSGYYMGVSSGSDDGLEFARNNAGTKGAVLGLTKEGVHNHYANSIVNSATVAGLQDGGACYDFDGSDDWIDAGSGSGIDNLDKITISAWVKFEGWGESNAGRIVSKTSTANTAGWTLYVNNSGQIGLLDTWTTVNGQYITVNQVVQLNKWCHIAVTYDRSTASQAPTFYVNGTVATYDSTGSTNSVGSAASDAGSPLLVGARRINSTSVDREFNGQIRDVKVFPSELDAADIRKLYSGENPKKNNNVELVSNGTFDSNATPPSGWAVGDNGETLTANNGTATLELINGGGSEYPKARISLGTLTSGKTYHLKVGNYTRKSGNSIRIKINNNGNVNVSQPAGTLLYNSTSNVVDGNFFYTATSTEEHYLWMYMQDYTNGTSEAEFDNLSVKEVGTLVDFTPQSASSSKWRNEAIPSLYHGTVNNATLSQGNTYWNNIKQDRDGVTIDTQVYSTAAGGQKVYYPLTLQKDDVGNTLDQTTAVGVGVQFKLPNNETAGGSFLGSSIYATRENSSDSNSRSGLSFNVSGNDETLDEALRISSDLDVKVHGKLGVGHDAHATHHLSVNGSSNFLGSLFLTNSTAANINAVTGHMGLYFDSDSNANVADRSFTIYNRAAAAFKIDGNSNVAIGSTTPQQTLDVNGGSNSWGASFGSQIALGNAPHDNWVGIHIGYKETGNNNYRKSGIAFQRTTGYANGLLHILNNGTSDNSTADLDDSVHSWDYDGTQDHKANRIVNSQTVNDSWRTPEPSLKISGNNKVVVPTTVYDVDGGEYTFIFRVKRGTTQSTHSIIANGPSRYYDKIFIGQSGTILHIETSTNGNAAQATLNTTALDNKWHEYAIVTNGDGSVDMYQDGVALTVSGTLTNNIDLRTIGGAYSDANTEYDQNFEINSFRIHNRKLEADEIKGYYNGESTPWVYADTPTTERITLGDFSGSTGQPWDWNTGWSHSSTNENMAYDGTSGTGRVYQTVFTTADVGKKFRVTFTVGGNTGYIWIGNSSGNNAYVNGNYINYAVGTHSVEFTLPSGETTIAFYSQNSSAAFTLDDVSVVQIGEVAAYTPKSIGTTGGKWSDTTSNNNHGTITGATNVNETVLGALQIKGATDRNRLQIFGTESNAERLELFHTGTDGYIQSTASTGSHYGLNFRARQYYFATWRDSAWTNSVRIESNGAVTATSAASDNLKQVARVYSKTVVVNTTGGGNALNYVLTHNLGTKGIITSVQDSNNNMVEVDVEATTDNTATFKFASATSVGSDENFIFTIMGGGAPEAA